MAWMAGDLPQGRVAVGVGHQEAGASLLEQAVREVYYYLGVEEASRSRVGGLVWSLLVAEGDVRASLMEGLVVLIQRHGLAWVLMGVMVAMGPHEAKTEQVEVCWAREEGHLLESLAWMGNLGGPWEDQGRCLGHQQGILGV